MVENVCQIFVKLCRPRREDSTRGLVDQGVGRHAEENPSQE